MTETISGAPETQPTLAELALTDTLTGLSNARHFKETVQAALGEEGTDFAVFVLDLDRFKAVNDTLGHPTGDQLLRKVSDRLQSAMPPAGLLARLGGDEFAVLLQSAEEPALLDRVASRMIELLDRPFLIEGHQVNVGSSIGIARRDQSGSNYERLMKHADLALYAAKEAGRGTFRYFHQDLADHADARRTLELELRKALPLRQFEVHYRPRLDVMTGNLVGLKAELFWRHPQRKLLAAPSFEPLATQIGLIPKIGKWLLEAACRDAAAFPEPVAISVGILEAQFSDRGLLVEAVQGALLASRLEPRLLEIEITESLLLSQEQTIVRTMHALRSMGVRIVMNDFGIGYASLTKLTSFPFDGIKIASSITGEGSTAANRAIVQAVASFGASLGVATLIEGISSEAQLSQLRRDGGDTLQGCRLEPAVPCSALFTLLQAPRVPSFERTGER